MNELLERLLVITEGIKDLRRQYVDSGKIGADTFSALEREDPSDRHKYLGWMIRQYLLNPEKQRQVIDVTKLFDQQVQRNKLQGRESNIEDYDLESANAVVTKLSSEKTKGEINRQIKSNEADLVEETDKYIIISPKTYAASCKYGAGTKWCTTERSPRHWDVYYNANVKFYYILMKGGEKYAVAVFPSGKMKAFNEKDKKMSMSKLIEVTGVSAKLLVPTTPEEVLVRLTGIIVNSCTKNPDGTYSSNGSVNLSGTGITKFPVKFKYIGGVFWCENNELTSLEGVPDEVGGDFYCNNNKLTSLEGAPSKVGGSFYCSNNELTSLEGAPSEVGAGFFCDSNVVSSEKLRKIVNRGYKT